LPAAVLRVDPLPLGDDGLHILPAHVAAAAGEAV
jgi:uncharacterized protein (DUF952 family)